MKRKLIETEIEQINNEFQKNKRVEIPEMNLSELSEKELKEKLKCFGVTTKVRKKEKLVSMLTEAMKSSL